jgi:hypothetical protein
MLKQTSSSDSMLYNTITNDIHRQLSNGTDTNFESGDNNEMIQHKETKTIDPNVVNNTTTSIFDMRDSIFFRQNIKEVSMPQPNITNHAFTATRMKRVKRVRRPVASVRTILSTDETQPTNIICNSEQRTVHTPQTFDNSSLNLIELVGEQLPNNPQRRRPGRPRRQMNSAVSNEGTTSVISSVVHRNNLRRRRRALHKGISTDNCKSSSTTDLPHL